MLQVSTQFRMKYMSTWSMVHLLIYENNVFCKTLFPIPVILGSAFFKTSNYAIASRTVSNPPPEQKSTLTAHTP